MTHLLKFCPSHIFGIGEAKRFKCRVVIDTRGTSAYMIYYPKRACVSPKGVCSVSRDLFQFWEISDNISLMVVQDGDIVAVEN